MGNTICAFVLVTVFAVAASGNVLTVYFGRPEYVPPTTDLVANDSYISRGGAAGLTQPPGTYTLGIWAKLDWDLSGSEPVMDN
jgi:hypothetical protein